MQENDYKKSHIDVEAPEDLLIHISYTWKRQTVKHTIITESWIMEENHQYHQ